MRHRILILSALCVLAFTVIGCKSYKAAESSRVSKSEKYVSVNDTIRDTVRIDRLVTRLDSVYLHDSVSVRVGGDTVYVDRWHTLVKHVAASSDNNSEKVKERIVHDTCYVSKASSVTEKKGGGIVKTVLLSMLVLGLGVMLGFVLRMIWMGAKG